MQITERQRSRYKGRTLNKRCTFEMLPIKSLKLDRCQRMLDQAHAVKCIRQSGGLDWFKMQPIDVVRNSQGECTVINGQHRLAMLEIVLPDEEQVQCRVIETDSQAQAARLFADFNARGIKRVKDTDLLWAEIIAESPQALRTYGLLKKMNLRTDRVNEYTDEGQPTGALNIDLAAFNRCCRWGVPETERAVDLYRRAWPRERGVNGDVITGLTRLLTFDHLRRDLAPSTQYGQNFDQWFVATMQHLHINRAKYENYRNARAGWYDGVAWGLLEDFTQSQFNQGRGAPQSLRLKEQHGNIGVKR